LITLNSWDIFIR